MSSAKPDWGEIASLKRERNLYQPSENIFFPIHQKCLSAIEGGYITLERANFLRKYLFDNDRIASIFPNNLLLRLLGSYCEIESRSSVEEGLLLGFIVDFYLDEIPLDQSSEEVVLMATVSTNNDFSSLTLQKGQLDQREISPPDIQFVLQDYIDRDKPLINEIRGMIFDEPTERIQVKSRFVGFSGKFAGDTRKSCFQKIRKMGGVPCDPEYFLDYFFAGNNLVSDLAISSKLSNAISIRRTYGNPLIFTEEDWRRII